MAIPLLLLPGVFFLLFLVWVGLTLANVYHVIRYANWTRMPLVLIFLYLFLATSIIVGTGWMLRDVDWQQDIDFETPTFTVPSAVDDFDINDAQFSNPLE